MMKKEKHSGGDLWNSVLNGGLYTVDKVCTLYVPFRVGTEGKLEE